MKTILEQTVMPPVQWQCAFKAFTEDVTQQATNTSGLQSTYSGSLGIKV